MKLVYESKDSFVLRFDRGEKYPAVFIRFLKKNKIRGGFFFGLGAFFDPEIACYNLKKEKYLQKKFRGAFEVASLLGNVSVLGNDVFVHTHVVLGRRNYSTISGHLISARVSATLEVYFAKTKNLRRKIDKGTGFKFLV